LRGLGKNLVDLSSEIVSCERDQILLIIRNLKTQLISSLGIFIFLGAFLIPFFAFKILRSLNIIQQTTLRIAKGDFRPIAVEDTHDETQRVIEAFNRMVAELEHRQDQLLQAKKLSSLGTLTSGIAHQLNNPLNNISTSCQILLEDLDPHIQFLDADSCAMLSRMLRNIEQEVYRARDIVKGLLEFSREREFCLSSSKLRKVVIRSIELISSQVPPGVQILHDIPDDLCLNIDTQRMQQVFLNLIENSLHAIGNSGGQIRIDAKIISGQEVVITVEDTGEGIAPDELARIFDPFYTTKEVGSGTGLGLSIVYGIIQKHNGLIEVESKKNEGTRFIIRLPLERVC
jgi:signal transduction histidine kinase